MERRLIDGLELYCDLKKLEELARQRYLDTPSNSPVFTTYKAQMHERTALKEMVSATPTIEAVPVVHGKWILSSTSMQCSECKKVYEIDLYSPICAETARYCPSCGAKMEDTL